MLAASAAEPAPPAHQVLFQINLQKYPDKLPLIRAMIHLYVSRRILFFVTIEIITILETMVGNHEGYSRHRPHGVCRAL
ncbi:hypothetical protein NE852_13380 [Rhizobium sp. Pop5]|uniref:hypothetical protein n=1 Tax=Rhizobium sp. Pop5 TaxID=1223565 RepID=UPI000AB29797|nr:hypothetical protein [Rhizobium sp. Pop5]UVD59240.1 hypothetical protein NE852_13380 [Rhizobium sp. Pop5]